VDPEKVPLTPKQKKYMELEEKMVQKVYSPPLSEKSAQSLSGKKSQ
jgi:hypothetical protein